MARQSFRQSLDKKKDGSVKNTSVFMGAKYNGFPTDDYSDNNTIGHGSPLNFRNTWTLHNNLTNLLRAGRENWSFEETIEINGHSIPEINDQLHDEGNGDLTMIASKPFANFITEKESEDEVPRGAYFEQMMDEGAKIVNPVSVLDSNNKQVHYKIFQESEDGFLPWADIDAYMELDEKEQGAGVRKLYENFNEMNIPLVVKPKDGCGGNGISFTTSEELVEESYNAGGIDPLFRSRGLNPNKGWMVQAAVPSHFDARVLAGEDVPVNSILRKGDNFIHNMDGGGEAKPVKREFIDPGVQNALEDFHDLLEEGLDLHDNAGTYLGWDFLAVEPEHEMLDGYPEFRDFLYNEVLNEDYKFQLSGYGVENDFYAIPNELNVSPGSKTDNKTSMYPHQNSAFGLVKYADDLSRGDAFRPIEEGQLMPSHRKMIHDSYSE